jgi:opacity protein-like surface antigen
VTILHRLTAVSGALVALSILSAALPAKAEHEPKPHPGPAPVNTIDATVPGTLYFLLDFSLGDTKDAQTDADFDVSLTWTTAMGLGVGYRAGPVRLEGAWIHHFFRVEDLEVGLSAPFADGDYAGGVIADAFMASLYFDLPTGGRAKPYLGAGYGIATLEAKYNEAVCFLYCFSTENEIVDDWDNVAAWQAMVGVSFPTRTSTIEWYIGYRYFGTDDATMVTVDGDVFTQEGLNSHSVNGGFRFFF